MKIKQPLFLVSRSPSRQDLLKQAKIPFLLIDHTCDERAVVVSGSLENQVVVLASAKMACAVIPQDVCCEGSEIFLLSADTMGQDKDRIIHGKPKDYEEAVEKIKKLRFGGSCSTGFCIEKRMYQNGSWMTVGRVAQAVTAEYIFNIPDDDIKQYIETTNALEASGGISIEKGLSYLKSINGSYTTILGLPLFEVYRALKGLGFLPFDR